MEETTVPDVDLRRLHLSFADAGEERGELTDHEGIGQQNDRIVLQRMVNVLTMSAPLDRARSQ